MVIQNIRIELLLGQVLQMKGYQQKWVKKQKKILTICIDLCSPETESKNLYFKNGKESIFTNVIILTMLKAPTRSP